MNRSSSSERTSLGEGGLKPEDVTYVAIGNPVTGYAALAIGKQIDAIIMYQPLTQICQFNKTCETVIDMTINEGPKSVAATSGANVIFGMRREMADGNPELMKAFYEGLKAGKSKGAALREAERTLRTDERYRHPYYWAPFILIGDWR